MSGVLIISHIDADGVISAHLLSKFFGYDVSVVFPEWYKFGEPDIIPDEAKTYEKVCVADLGTNSRLLEKLQELSINAEVYLFDHHQPEGLEPNFKEKYSSPNLHIIWSDKNCAAGLIYQYALENGYDKDDEWFNAWAGIAVLADGFADSPGGQEVISKVRETVPWVFWNIAYRTKYGEDSYPYGVLFASYINAARRLAYHKGAYIALSALSEAEQAGLEILRSIIPTGDELTNYMAEAEYPNLALLIRWYEIWLEKRRDIFERYNITTFTFDKFGVSIINHPWDIGGYVAATKAKDKPHFCINYGVPHDRYANISGRQGSKVKINLSQVMKIANELSGGAISGGGHIDACGGLVDRNLKVEDVILLLEEAVAEASGMLNTL